MQPSMMCFSMTILSATYNDLQTDKFRKVYYRKKKGKELEESNEVKAGSEGSLIQNKEVEEEHLDWVRVFAVTHSLI